MSLVSYWQEKVREWKDTIDALVQRIEDLGTFKSNVATIQEMIDAGQRSAKGRVEKLAGYGLSQSFMDRIIDPVTTVPSTSDLSSAIGTAIEDAGKEKESAETEKTNAETSLSNAKKKEEEEKAECGSLQ